MDKKDEKTSATVTKADSSAENRCLYRMPPKLEAMINNAFTVDCTFIIGGNLGKAQTIFGHKLMFSLHSDVFESMLSGHFLEAKSTEIPLPDDDPKTFRNLRLILYNLRDTQTELNELDLSDTISLYKLCDKYLFKTISKLCVEHLKSFIGDDQSDCNNAIKIFPVAIDLHNLELLGKVKAKLSIKFYPLLSILNDLNPLHFLKYIELHAKQNQDVVNHLNLFKAIENYLTVNDLIPQELLDTEESLQKPGQGAVLLLSEERSLEFLQKLLTHIDFVRINIADYLRGPGVSKILTWKQKYIVLSQLCINPQPSTIKLFQN
ncbi:uncharacterized protein LOC109613447 [Musca domestica]|uniref:Uncharacterized protein LOC109613447 n=1 Tax=Musca domestica TaxID=7370 RepID=A0ABM3VJP4_MUSDO|nr:uncharacterized protein LOC109613447 [Musca domestica]